MNSRRGKGQTFRGPPLHGLRGLRDPAARPAVDPTGASADEADRSAGPTASGSCAQLLQWARRRLGLAVSDRSIGCCRACVFKHHGLNRPEGSK